MQPDTSYPPDRAGQVPQSPDVRIQHALIEYQEVLERRLEEGLAAINLSAERLMREVASEVWRSAGGDTSDTRSKIVEFISRDQAIRSLIATSDERFQALSARTERLEDALARSARSGEQMRELVERATEALSQIAPTGGEEGVGTQLERIDEHLATTMRYISERDRALVEGIGAQVREHGAMVAKETERMVEAMQLYVKDGVDAMSRLAQHVEATAGRDGELAERINAELTSTIGEQLQMIYERLGIEARSLADALASHESWEQRELGGAAGSLDERFLAQAETIKESARLASTEVTRLLESRVMGLAQLVRSDSEALRGRLVEAAAAQDEAMARILDERLARVSETIDRATRWTADETVRRIEEATAGAIDRRIGDAESRIAEGARAMEDSRTAIQAMRGEAEEAAGRAMDQRIAGLAKMIRSDNQILAEKVRTLAEQEPAKQTLRAVKELQATMGGEMAGMLERKFAALSEQLHRETQSIAESVAASNEVLSGKVDRATSRAMDRGAGGKEMQTVIARMGDAMHALAAMGRPAGPEERIDLEELD